MRSLDGGAENEDLGWQQGKNKERDLSDGTIWALKKVQTVLRVSPTDKVVE